MLQTPLEKYMDKLNNMNDKEYLFGVMVYHAAPVLLSDKPSCIITLANNKRNLNLLYELYKEEFKSKCELKIYEIKDRIHSKTLFIYDEIMLSKVVYEDENIRFLERFGYHKNLVLEEMLRILKERFKYLCPHEMGVFLGFPLEDVSAFMKKPHEESLLTGYWKVYNNVDYAKRKFLSYDNAKLTIANSVLDGMLPSKIIKHTYIHLI